MKQRILWMLTVIMTYGFVMTSCSNSDSPVVPPTDEVEALLQKMTLREKIGQMFYIRIESLDPSIEWTTYDDLAARRRHHPLCMEHRGRSTVGNYHPADSVAERKSTALH